MSLSGLELYALGIPYVFQPEVLLWLVVGVVSGILVGALPGLSATMAVAVITPLTFTMEPITALALLLGTYCSALYGGSISAILVNIPGTPGAVMTTLDGYPMAQKGKAGQALGIATVASVLGGLFSVVVLMVAAPPIANLALKFSAQEYFALALFGVSMMAYVSSGSLAKGLLSGMIGLLIATIGTDPTTGTLRFTFGIDNLLSGLDVLPVLIGLFGLTEILTSTERIHAGSMVKAQLSKMIPSRALLFKNKGTILRSSVVGTLVGAAPAAGGTIAAIIAYGMEKRISKHPEKFGTGIPEGIFAPETANNASTGGAMIPMLTLGIPGDAVTAILIGALMIHGLQPGPMLFAQQPHIVSSIFILMALANVLFLFVGLGGARMISKVLNVHPGLLYPMIALMCIVGTYAARNFIFDVVILLIFGVMGYGFSKIGIPAAPMVLGVILGPIVESNFRRALVISEGSITPFFTRPISATFMILTILIFISPWLNNLIPYIKKKFSSKYD